MMISAIVLAAGISRRMGRPKMTLRWGEITVIGQVVSVLVRSGLQEIMVVTGGAQHQVETALQDFPVDCVFNPGYSENEMMGSLQTGLSALSGDVNAAMVVLGDQPCIQEQVVERLFEAYAGTQADLIVPSYLMQRGHPWIVARSLWPEIMNLNPPETLRNFMKDHAEKIHYVSVNTATILGDIDTPGDYENQRPVDSHNDSIDLS